jgi:hypothetical protein
MTNSKNGKNNVTMNSIPIKAKMKLKDLNRYIGRP